jgi:hypothetical protein
MDHALAKLNESPESANDECLIATARISKISQEVYSLVMQHGRRVADADGLAIYILSLVSSLQSIRDSTPPEILKHGRKFEMTLFALVYTI